MFIDKSQVTTNTNTDLVNIHALIKPLFSKEMLTKAVNIPPAGRISPFLINWQKLTSNQDIISVIKGYNIPFIKSSFQQKIPNFTKINKNQVAFESLK